MLETSRGRASLAQARSVHVDRRSIRTIATSRRFIAPARNGIFVRLRSDPFDLRGAGTGEARLDLVEREVPLLKSLDGAQAREMLGVVTRVLSMECGRGEQTALHVVADRPRSHLRGERELVELERRHESEVSADLDTVK